MRKGVVHEGELSLRCHKPVFCAGLSLSACCVVVRLALSSRYYDYKMAYHNNYQVTLKNRKVYYLLGNYTAHMELHSRVAGRKRGCTGLRSALIGVEGGAWCFPGSLLIGEFKT